MLVHIPIPGHERTVLLLCFAFTFGMGVYDLYRGLTAGPCRQIMASDLEHGKPAPGPWLKVRGHALWTEASRRSEDHGYTTYVVPVISDDPDARTHAAVFMDYHLKDEPPPTGPTGISEFEGVLLPGRGLAGDDQKLLAVHGITRANDYVLLKPGGTPRDVIGIGCTFLTISAACLALIPAVRWMTKKLPHK